MFANISVLVPTRKRLPQLQALIKSFCATTSRGAELIFRIDDDDVESFEATKAIPWCKTLVGPRLNGYRSLPQFFFEMYAVAEGDVIMTGNDDMVFRTPAWPDLLLDVANQYPDGVFCLGVETHNAANFPFAAVSRKAIQAMGHVHDSRVFWGDVYLRDVMAHFGRAVQVPSVRVDHNWMGLNPDTTFLEAQQGERKNWDTNYWALHHLAVAEAVKKLEAACLIAQ